MKIKKIIITLIVLLAIIGIGIKGKALLKSRQAEIANQATPKTEAVTINIQKPKEGVLKNKEPYLATISSDKYIKLSTKLAGFVEKLYVEESDIVKKGDPLVQIDATELRSNISSLKATIAAQRSDVAMARSIYNRNKKLYEVGGLAKEKLDLSLVALNAKNSQLTNTIQKLRQAKHQLSYLKITAPFDGIVDSLMMHEGDLAAAGKPILTLSNSKKKLIFSYSPTAKSLISKGKKVYLENEEIGYIRAIYTTSKNGLISAEATLTKDIDLPIGANLNIEVLTKETKGCIVSQNSILHKKDGEYVLEYKDGSFSPKKVKVLLKDKNSILLDKCPNYPIAVGSEVKLSKLLAYKNIHVLGESYE